MGEVTKVSLLSKLRWAISTLAFVSVAFPGAAFASDAPNRLTRACGQVFSEAEPGVAAVWAGRYDRRIVVYAGNGDRFECDFAADSDSPELNSVQVTSADKSVAVYSGTKLKHWNAMLATPQR